MIDVYIGFLMNLYGPEVINDELFNKAGKILNLNFISAIAQRPTNKNRIKRIRSKLPDGIIAPVSNMNNMADI